ncbi:MAG: dihydroorotase [Candidatus Diapherotrites archaeon]|nr:dihydroorotase [Candidatus Diapherotrites archaeon]
MQNDLVLANGKVFFKGHLVEANVGIAGGKISDISKLKIEGKQQDCHGRIILPGLIDVHVHVREPGQEYKEDWLTASKAALAGGVTSFFDMPNNKRSIVTAELLEEKRQIAQKKSLANFGLYLGASNEHIQEISLAKNICGVKDYLGSTTGSLLVDKTDDVKKVFFAARQKGTVVAVHAEDEATIMKNAEKFKGKNNPEIHSKIRPKKAAIIAVENALKIRAGIGNRLHVAHASVPEEIALVEKAKSRGQMVSCEVAPHHLFLTEQALKVKGNFAKMNPPLRSKKDVAGLWKALLEGKVDCIATDHAPHTAGEKEQDYWSAPSGVPGLQTTLPLMLTEVNANKIPLERVVRLCCENPAVLFRAKGKGFLLEGFDADFAIIDLKKEFTIKDGGQYSKCGWTPFDGRKAKGRAEMTVVNGQIVFDGEGFGEKIKGKEIVFGTTGE